MKKWSILILVLVSISTSALVTSAGGLVADAKSAQASPFTGKLRPEMLISLPTSPECAHIVPKAAYNSIQGEFLVVYQNQWSNEFQDIYAQRLSLTGELGPRFTVATGAYDDEKPRFSASLAYNPVNGEYLVVYMHAADGTHYEVWGRRVAWDGHWNGPEFKIFSWPNRAFYYPNVAWNSQHNQYLVIANAWDTVSRDWNDVAGRLVMADGSMPYAGYSISSQDQALEPSYGEVAYNPVVDEFLVIWQQKGATTFWDIYAARVGGENGTVVEPPGEYAIDDSSVTHHSPKLVVDPQGHYLVAYNGWNNVGTTYVRELDQTGSPIGESFTIGPVEASAGDPLIAIIPDTRQRLVFWREDDGFVESIWGISWYASASQPSGAAFLVARDVHYYPLGLASGSPGALVMYNRESAEGSQIFGRQYWPAASFLPLIVR